MTGIFFFFHRFLFVFDVENITYILNSVNRTKGVKLGQDIYVNYRGLIPCSGPLPSLSFHKLRNKHRNTLLVSFVSFAKETAQIFFFQCYSKKNVYSRCHRK